MFYRNRQQARQHWLSARKWLPPIMLIKNANDMVIHKRQNQLRNAKTLTESETQTKRTATLSELEEKRKQTDWSDAFRVLIMNPQGRQLFTEFLEGEYSDENIIFYAACEELQLAETEAQLRIVVNDIYKTFIAVDSPLEINVDREIRNEITDRICNGPMKNDIFRRAETHIYQLMEKDCFGRFVHTKAYETFSKKHARKSL